MKLLVGSCLLLSALSGVWALVAQSCAGRSFTVKQEASLGGPQGPHGKELSDLVSAASAYYTYYEAAYPHRCAKPTKECASCRATLDNGEWQVKAAQVNLQYGVLTPAEADELRKLIIDLKTNCP